MAISRSLPKVAIIGAGPAGLTLASLLHKANPKFTSNITVFELRPQPPSDSLKRPSGSLDLHKGSGLLAIEKCGLSTAFQTHNTDCSEQMIITDKHGKVCIEEDSGNGERPEISRNALQHILLSTIPKDIVRWNTKISCVTPGTDRRWRITSSSTPQEEQEFDLVVGADGAWSKARDAIKGASKPTFGGTFTFSFVIPEVSTRFPSLNTMIGKGTYMACGEHKAVISQRAVLDSTTIYLWLGAPTPTHFAELGLDVLPPPQLKEKLLNSEEFFRSWAPEIKKLIATACDTAEDAIETRNLYTLPVGHSWAHTPGVTLIGDAAHLTTPNGEGVNLAMFDALKLAEAITSSHESSLDETIKAFEEKMFVRAIGNSEDALNMKKMMFDDADAPQGFVRIMEGFMEGQTQPAAAVFE